MTDLKVINGYENFGDVSLEHGIILVKKDTLEDCYYILKTNYDDDAETYLLFDLYIDISDDWIDWDDVKSYCDTDMSNDTQKAIDAVSYYSSENFGSVAKGLTLDNLESTLLIEYEAIETEVLN